MKPFIDLIGSTDFITTMGAGVHAHPDGTQAGAAALVQACEAYEKGIDIHDYAKNKKELAEITSKWREILVLAEQVILLAENRLFC